LGEVQERGGGRTTQFATRGAPPTWGMEQRCARLQRILFICLIACVRCSGYSCTVDSYGEIVASEYRASGTWAHELAPLGDFDGDGVDDLMVSSSGNFGNYATDGEFNLLLLNADGTEKQRILISSASPSWSWLYSGTSTDRELTRSLASLGDLDGDGVIDIAIGAGNVDDGSSETPGSSAYQNANFGAFYVAFLNADGSSKGYQKISATDGGLSTYATLEQGDRLGDRLWALGDLDGDGRVEIGVGLHEHGSAGVIWVLGLNADGTVASVREITQGQSGFTATLAADDGFGSSITAIGDLDGDGVVDLAVGAEKDDTGGVDRGAIYILFRNSDGSIKSHQKIASNTGGLAHALGNSWFLGRDEITAIGDFNGDGIVDLAAGMSFVYAKGRVFVLFLDTDGTVKDYDDIWDGTGRPSGVTDPSWNGFGKKLAYLGDPDGDGRRSLAVTIDDHTNIYGTGQDTLFIMQLRSSYCGPASPPPAPPLAPSPPLAPPVPPAAPPPPVPLSIGAAAMSTLKSAICTNGICETTINAVPVSYNGGPAVLVEGDL
jgi:hypothetical protein